MTTNRQLKLPQKGFGNNKRKVLERQSPGLSPVVGSKLSPCVPGLQRSFSIQSSPGRQLWEGWSRTFDPTNELLKCSGLFLQKDVRRELIPEQPNRASAGEELQMFQADGEPNRPHKAAAKR